ncbi:polysaccharide biosynthesis C-terminal domain-containing protein [Pseudonocardia acidicola]|uniref:Oligosaccharide flippase family protein n=1 Tax=Pseudonocardia acidicola TaxID=2724939 RepID=A0ABX1S7S0_9PSEU|nr:oligosaccharide flippase family protein [Pseudonocardia acidicola]
MSRPQATATGSRPAPGLGRRSATANLVAQGGALAALSVASLLVARWGGAAVLGEYALLRVLPWLTGVVISAGLPVASTYYVAGERGADPRLRPTLTALAMGGSVLGVLAWTLAAPALDFFFPATSRGQLLLAGVTVATQLVTVWGKACCQGTADMRGSNLIIVTEELMFLPAYGVALAVGLDGIAAVLGGLVGGGVAAATVSVGRLAVTGFFRGWGAPSAGVARRVIVFGARGQLGNLLWLVNLRLDFLVLGALAGPAVLGVYAVASKFAELMRLPATACNYVLYPRFARSDRAVADAEVRRLMPRAVALTAAATPLLALAAAFTLPLLYGETFRGAVVPACVLLVGLAVEGAAAVASAYLWGVGRPGANSAGMAAGVVVTVALDVVLIPRHGALGAAIASSVAYLVTAAVLVGLTRRLARPLRAGATPRGAGGTG